MIGATGLIWDACCLLNLLATRHGEQILAIFGCPSYIVKEVRSGELLYLRPLPEEDPSGNLVGADVTTLLNARLLEEVQVEASETETFVTLAAALDDGEARSAAVAAHRNWWLVTDDRPSLRAAEAYVPQIRTVTTPEWMKYWAEQDSVTGAVLEEALRRVEVCAHYVPRRNHALKAWWDAHIHLRE